MATTRENKPISAVEWTKRYLDAVFKKDEDTIKELECMYPYNSATPNECREMLGYTTLYVDNIPFVTCETFNDLDTRMEGL